MFRHEDSCPADDAQVDAIPLFATMQKKDERRPIGEDTGDDAAIRLLFDDEGAYLQIVDAKGSPRDADPHGARGPLRDLLKAIARIQRRQRDLVAWEGDANRLYLHHHEHLLWPLRQGVPLADAEG